MSGKVYFIVFALITVISSREVEIENFKPDSAVKSDGFFDFGTLRLKKISKNRFSISGDFELYENCGNEKELLLEVRKYGNKKDNRLMMKSEDKFCDFLKNEKFIWPDIQERSNFPEGNPCPLPKGKYWIKDLIIDEKKFPMFPAGDYTGRVAASQNNKLLAAVDVDCKITP